MGRDPQRTGHPLDRPGLAKRRIRQAHTNDVAKDHGAACPRVPPAVSEPVNVKGQPLVARCVGGVV